MAANLATEELRELLRTSDRIPEHTFDILRSIASMANDDNQVTTAREMVLRALQFYDKFGTCTPMLDALARSLGYFPYCDPENLDLRDTLAYEMHRPLNIPDLVFHREQAIVYRRLLAGDSVILSAPTSFGKSRIIDAMIATGKFNNVAVIVPTLALIDETRRRLAQFSDKYKLVTHLSQTPGEKNIFVLTAERAVAYEKFPRIDFLVVDEFYKLDALDEDSSRTVALNQAFYKLKKNCGQFYLLGPNIKEIPANAEGSFRCVFHKTNYATVVAEQKRVRTTDADDLDRLVELAQTLTEPTLIFCRSPQRVNEVARKFLEKGIGIDSPALTEAAKWTANTYHPDWVFGKALLRGIGIHHGRLPRSLAQYAVRAFNDLKLRFLICTTTLIEGVNTKAKNVIIFDNKVVGEKIDFFTFSNIKGRSGRMFEHYVGRVFIFHDPPEETLPFVDFPLLTQDERVPESLLIQIEEPDLTKTSKDRLKKYNEQTTLPVSVIRSNSAVNPDAQIALAKTIESEPDGMSALLSWTYPNWDQLKFACELIWAHFVSERRKAMEFSQ